MEYGERNESILVGTSSNYTPRLKHTSAPDTVVNTRGRTPHRTHMNTHILVRWWAPRMRGGRALCDPKWGCMGTLPGVSKALPRCTLDKNTLLSPAQTRKKTNETDSWTWKASKNHILLSDNENGLQKLGIKANVLKTLIPDVMGNAASSQTACDLKKKKEDTP